MDKYHKYVTLRVNRDYGFEPVLSEFDDSSFGAADGKFVSRVKCIECGKLYRWNSHSWITKHWRSHGHT